MAETIVIGGHFREERTPGGQFRYSADIMFVTGRGERVFVPNLSLERFGNRAPSFAEFAAAECTGQAA